MFLSWEEVSDMMKFFSLILLAALIYVVIGVLFAIAFLSKGIKTVDHSAQSTSLGFKLLILPGCVVLWLPLFFKWIKAGKS